MDERDVLIQDLRRELAREKETIRALAEDRGKWMALAKALMEKVENTNKTEEQEMNEKYCIIRGDRSGVFFGIVKERNGREVTLTNCRRLWYWDGAASISQLAVNGTTRPGECKFTVTVPEITILDVIEIIPCEDKAVESIQRVREWKM